MNICTIKSVYARKKYGQIGRTKQKEKLMKILRSAKEKATVTYTY